MSAYALLWLVASGPIACGKPDATRAIAVIDSAGIRIVNNARPQASGTGQWATLDREPELAIGGLEGAAPYTFSALDGAAVRATGEILVVDRSAHEIRVFDSAGNHVRTIGRAGAGPGEFGGSIAIRLVSPDTVLVWDATLQRLSWFTFSGEFIKDQSLAKAARTGPVLRVAGDRWEVHPNGTVVGYDFAAPTGEGVIPQRIKLVFGNGRWTDVHSIRGLPGSLNVRVGKTQAPSFLHPSVAPFNWSIQPAPPGIVVADDSVGRWELSVYDFDGNLKTSIRAAIPRRRVTDELVQSSASWLLDFAGTFTPPAERRNLALAVSRRPVPDSTPAISSVLTDAESRFWVQRWRGRWEPTRGRIDTYDVIDAGGRWLGWVNVDASLGKILWIGDDHILFEWTDSLDVPQVREHRLRHVPQLQHNSGVDGRSPSKS